MEFSVRVSFPENEEYDWLDAVKIFERVGFIEVAFFNSDLFLKVDIGKIIKPFAKLNLEVSSLHFAQFSLVNLDLFAKVFHKTIKIAKSLDCDSIVIHPSMGRLKAIGNFLKEKIDPILEKEKIYFCWETFESKKRIFGGLENLANYCRNTQYHRICYDFSHIHKDQQEILKDLEKYLDLIRIFHISNRIKGSIKQHYPVYYTQEDMALNFDEILTFLKQRNFNGHLVLEYLPQFHSQLLPDVLSLKKQICFRKMKMTNKGHNYIESNSPKVYIRTYGCQMNEYDSEIMAGLLNNDGYSLTDNLQEADVILLNTCYVREKVKHRIYSRLGELRKVKEENPDIILGLCGCLVQREPEEILRRAPYLDFVLGTSQFYHLPEVLKRLFHNRVRDSKARGSSHFTIVQVEEDGPVPEDLSILRKSKISAFVSIMRGCNNFCSYCNVPYVRGREVSRSSREILKEVEGLSLEGYKEVTLLGQNVNSYGKNGKEKIDFADLLVLVNKVEGIRRIRFTTSHPRDLTNKLIEKMAELDKVCEHIHLPVQSGSNKILSRMKRGYTREHYKNLVDKLRQAIPQITLTTDIIVGFPGEEEEDFRNTLELVETVGFDGAFTFCYSPLRGTEAAQSEERIPAEISGERLRRLIELQQAILLKKNKSLVGRKFEVMVEGISKKNPDEVEGRTRGNKIIIFPGGKNLIGRFIWVEIVKAGCWALKGKVISC